MTVSVTNPTSTTPAATTAASTTAADQADAAKQKDQFLKILMTQLQNQNPLNPQDPTQFATQLAQYSQLEQQIDTNSKLDTLTTALTSGNISPISYLGTTVDYSSGTAPVQNEAATWTYSTTAATSVALSITDSTGAVVYTGTGDTSSGSHTLTLNSLAGVPDGTPLTLSVTATDSTGAAVTPTITSRATITAVDTTSGTTSLDANGYSISSSLIQRIATTPAAAAASSGGTSTNS